uniref:Uncharacterized protein n=1 Tax=Globodera rostochiensis TaxID=31243 RepID=A0A914GSK9_GLORO
MWHCDRIFGHHWGCVLYGTNIHLHLWCHCTCIATIIYLLFALIVHVKGRKVIAAGVANASLVNQRSIFIQVVLISCMNAIASAIYVSMNFVPLSEVLILAGQYVGLWLMNTKMHAHKSFFTLPDGATSIRTLETSRVTTTTTATKSIRTIMSQANRMHTHTQRLGSKSDEQIERVQMSDFIRTTLVNTCCKNK